MGSFVLTTVSNSPILAQAAPAAKAATERAKDKVTSGSIPKFDINPNFGGMKGLQVASQTSINLIAAVVIAALILAFLVGIIYIVWGKVGEQPHKVSIGKTLIVVAPILALLASMGSEVVGWGWGMGLVEKTPVG